MNKLLLRLFEPRINGTEIVSLLAELLQVRISDSTIKIDLEQHPDYPSLLSISDILNTYGIENLGIKFDNEKFTEIPVPFITQLEDINSKINFFTVVKEIKGDIIYFFDPEKHHWGTLVKNDFLKRCSGVALLVEVGEYAGEKDYQKNRKEEKRKNAGNYLIALCIPAIVLAAGVLALAQYGTSALLPFVFSILTLAGAITATLLLWYELDQHNPLLQQICSAGKNVNCGAVLHSKAAKIGGISWSVIGFSYFMGILLLLLFWNIANPAVLLAVSWINAIAASYVLYSVYYQWRVVRQWCVLCLCVCGILLLQLTIALFGGWHTLSAINGIKTSLIISVISAFTIPFVAATMLMPALQKAKESKRLNIELQQLKHNRQIFEALLQKQKEVTEKPDGLGISIGNHNAAFKLIKVCNPYCGPCAKAHTPMEELLHNNLDVQIQLIFTATNKEGDPAASPVKHLLAIAEKNEEPILKQALVDWYRAENKNYDAFAAKHPMHGELKQQETKIENMRNWCDKTAIAYTPTFFVSIPNDDGSTRYYQLPEIYRVADLKYFFSV